MFLFAHYNEGLIVTAIVSIMATLIAPIFQRFGGFGTIVSCLYGIITALIIVIFLLRDELVY